MLEFYAELAELQDYREELSVTFLRITY